MTGPHRQATRRIVATAAGVLIALLIAVPAAEASTPLTDIQSAGPLSAIYIASDLSCQVRNGGFSSAEYVPNASGPFTASSSRPRNGRVSQTTVSGPTAA